MMSTIKGLAEQARQGDRDALCDIVEMLRPKLFSAAYQDLRHYHDAQDAVAAAIYQICLHVASLRDTERVWPWMRTIVANEATKIRRRQSNHLVSPEDIPTSPGIGPDTTLAVDIQEALHRLPGDIAHAVTLFYLSGLSIDEIARNTERPVGTIKRWLHQGRRQLAIELEDYAPMQTAEAISAVIVSSEIPKESLKRFVAALEEAGFDKIGTVLWPMVFEAAKDEDNKDWQMPVPSNRVRFMLIDEWVAGRSVFEIQAAMKAVRPDMFFGVLLSSPAESTIYAAWAAGFELCLSKDDLEPNELARLCIEVLKRIRGERE
jgi:RNA polymerase sigma-70 factor, ECF subfamily